MSEWGLFLDRGSTPRSSTKSRTAERMRPVFYFYPYDSKTGGFMAKHSSQRGKGAGLSLFFRSGILY